MFFWFLFLALASSIVPPVTSDEDRLVFNSTFYCGYFNRYSWYYVIQYLDKDSMFSDDDVITQMIFNVVPPGRSEFKLEGKLDGDEHLSDAYEPYARIRHVCTWDKQEVTLILKLDITCRALGNGVCYYSFDRNVTDLWGEHTQKVQIKYERLTKYNDY